MGVAWGGEAAAAPVPAHCGRAAARRRNSDRVHRLGCRAAGFDWDGVSAHASVRLTAWLVGRPEWGRAMLAEVEQISDPRARRRFTWGCLIALALSVPVVVGGFVVAGLVSVAVVTAALIRYPGLVTGVGTWLAIGFFCAVIVGYVVAATGLSARLPTTMPTTAVWVSAAAIAGSWMLMGLCASAAPPRAVPMVLLVLGPGGRARTRMASDTTGYPLGRRSARGPHRACRGLRSLSAVGWPEPSSSQDGLTTPGWCETSGPVQHPTWRRTQSATASGPA